MKSSIRVQTWISNEKAKKLYEQLKSKKNGIEVALLYLAENGDKNLLNSIFKNTNKIIEIVEKKVDYQAVKNIETKVIQEKNISEIKNDFQEEKKEIKKSISDTNIMPNKKDGKPIFNLKVKK